MLEHVTTLWVTRVVDNFLGGFESNEEYQVIIDDTYSHAIAVSWKDPIVVSKFNMTAIPTDGLGRTATGLYTSEIPEVCNFQLSA